MYIYDYSVCMQSVCAHHVVCVFERLTASVCVCVVCECVCERLTASVCVCVCVCGV